MSYCNICGEQIKPENNEVCPVCKTKNSSKLKAFMKNKYQSLTVVKEFISGIGLGMTFLGGGAAVYVFLEDGEFWKILVFVAVVPVGIFFMAVSSLIQLLCDIEINTRKTVFLNILQKNSAKIKHKKISDSNGND